MAYLNIDQTTYNQIPKRGIERYLSLIRAA